MKLCYNIFKNIIFSTMLVSIMFNYASADFIVISNNQVDIRKDHKITARLEDDNKLITGYLQTVSGLDNNANNSTDNPEKTKVLITWVSLSSSAGKVALDGLSSSLFVENNKPIIASGTSLLVKGKISDKLNIKNKDDDKKDKNLGSSFSSGSPTTNITSPAQTPFDNSDKNTMFIPQVVTTFDGCTNTYDKDTEIITAYQQSYYLDKNGKKVITEKCAPAKDFPASRKTCDTLNDFTHHVTTMRYQPYFTVAGVEYTAGGCVPAHEYPHQIDYSVCKAQPIDDKYVKEGRWYYELETGDKQYISGCILDPEGETGDLLVQFQGCPVTHDIPNNQSVYLGQYYWVKDDDTVEYLSDCVLTKQSYFPEYLRWNDGQWVHHNDDWYSQRILTRYITITTEHREVIINDKELDPVHTQQTEKQDGWVNYDDLNRGGGNGYSARLMKRFVSFGSQSYYTGASYEGEHLAHKFLSSTMTRKEPCGNVFNYRLRRYYVDTIQRPDGSKYQTNEYNTGCTK